MTVSLKSLQHVRESDDVRVLGNIYEPDVNIVSWVAPLNTCVKRSVDRLIEEHQFRSCKLVLSESNPDWARLLNIGTDSALLPWIDDLTESIEMFKTLFDLTSVGVRVEKLTKASCPKFHVDNLPCRLVKTWAGAGTEYLSNSCVDRSKLGAASRGLSDDQSGVIQGPIQQVRSGSVTLLKGEGWIGNEGNGIVHRSPAATELDWRLVMTLDFA